MPRRELHRELIEVNPHHIKFNPNNPRRHQGTEFLRLKQSMQDIGVVQVPTVRVISGGFLEAIDGEGRILGAKEANLPSIPVISVGHISDEEALMMLQAANTVRSFNFLTECRGLANLHKQGHSTSQLASKFGASQTMMRQMVGIGYFPDEILTRILDDIAQSEDHADRWTCSLLYELLPLRQELPQPAAEHYCYKEVQRAVEKVLSGEITSATEMMAYATEWRLAFFQETFDQALEEKLRQEIERARRTLEHSHEEALKKVEQQTVTRYHSQVKSLQEQYSDLQKRHTSLLRDVAKQPETVRTLEEELRQQLQRTEVERTRLLNLQEEVQREAWQQERQLREQERQLEERSREQLELDRQEQQTALKSVYASREAELNASFEQKRRDLEIKAQTTLQQIIAQGVRDLAEARQWTLHLISLDVFDRLELSDPSVVALLAQMRALRETLEKVEEKLVHGEIVTERETYNGYQS